jgi:hypothetical protein
MPDPVTGLVVGGASLVSGGIQSNAAKKAANAQTAAAEAGIDEQRAQFEVVQQLLQPYVQAGTGALGAYQNLAGLGAPGAQQSAIASLSNSPEMQAMIQQGENAMLQNASATGGLRGGNMQAAMAQFRPQLLADQINQQFSRLGGLASIGQNAAAGVGNAGMNTGSAVSGLLAQQGAAQAGGRLAQGAAWGNAIGGIGQAVGMYGGMGGGFGGMGGGMTNMGTIQGSQQSRMLASQNAGFF